MSYKKNITMVWDKYFSTIAMIGNNRTFHCKKWFLKLLFKVYQSYLDNTHEHVRKIFWTCRKFSAIITKKFSLLAKIKKFLSFVAKNWELVTKDCYYRCGEIIETTTFLACKCFFLHHKPGVSLSQKCILMHRLVLSYVISCRKHEVWRNRG